MTREAQEKRQKKDLLLRVGDQIGDRLEHARRDFQVEARNAEAAHESDGTYHSSRRTADEANLCRQELRRRGRIIGEAWKRALQSESSGSRRDLVAFATADATRRLAVERIEISNLPLRIAGATAGSGAGYLVELERGLLSQLKTDLEQGARGEHWWHWVWQAVNRSTLTRLVAAALGAGVLMLAFTCGPG